MNTQDYRLFIAQNLDGSFSQQEINLELITGDASFRCYYRVSVFKRHYVLMVSPPDVIDNQPFILLNQVFENGQLRVPKILAQDEVKGLILLEDLGTNHFADCLGDGNDLRHYQTAIDLLPFIAKIPQHDAMKPYDAAFIEFELDIFKTWLVERFCGLSFDTSTEKIWHQVKCQLVNALEMQPQVTMHRDFHSRNLMLCENRWAIIDYQDAVQGPLCYDLVSLIKDCYHVMDAEQRSSLLRYGFALYSNAGLTQQLTFSDFNMLFTLTGIQRHLKAAGIFCRLSIRDGKHGYLPHVIATIDYVIEACQQLSQHFPNLDYFAQWLVVSVLPAFKEKL